MPKQYIVVISKSINTTHFFGLSTNASLIILLYSLKLIFSLTHKFGLRNPPVSKANSCVSYCQIKELSNKKELIFGHRCLPRMYSHFPLVRSYIRIPPPRSLWSHSRCRDIYNESSQIDIESSIRIDHNTNDCYQLKKHIEEVV